MKYKDLVHKCVKNFGLKDDQDEYKLVSEDPMPGKVIEGQQGLDQVLEKTKGKGIIKMRVQKKAEKEKVL